MVPQFYHCLLTPSLPSIPGIPAADQFAPAAVTPTMATSIYPHFRIQYIVTTNRLGKNIEKNAY